MAGAKKAEEKSVCGIVMPISKSDDDHTEAHWLKVKEIIAEAITSAGCEPQPVWEGKSHDIIQAKILQNLFENDIAVCDLSTRNANVMLEVGMRLTTKKPTLLIAEKGTKLPFDTGIIHTEFYDSKLEYAEVKKFVALLSEQIKDKLEAWKSDEGYQPYLAAFEFETVEPSKVTVSTEERMIELMESVDQRMRRLEKGDQSLKSNLGEMEPNHLRQAAAALFPSELGGKSREGSLYSRKAFIADIKATNRIDLLRDMRVVHPIHGEGRLTHLYEDGVLVDFDEFGLLVAEYDELRLLGNSEG